ncbi:transcription-repair coupling factor [bacterium]|nr:transcription-repair coupling factor [bacterium]
MLIHRIAAQIATAAEYRTIERALGLGDDATLAVGQSARPLLTAAVFARAPRPTLVVVAGEDAADRTANALAAYLGTDVVERFPERRDLPWSDKVADGAVIGARCHALARLAAGEPCVVVASARSLLRCVPPASVRSAATDGSAFFSPVTFAVGQETPFDDVPQELLYRGYVNAGAADEPGTFHVHGDAIDVFPSQARSAVRLEFFGDEIDEIRRVVVSTGQTIGGQDKVTLYPCRELAVTPDAVKRCLRKNYRAAQEDPQLATHMELLEQGVVFPELDRYLPDLYPSVGVPLDHVSADTLVVLAEPRSLFDDASHAYDDVAPAAREARVPQETLAGLYIPPARLDFGARQRLTFVSLMRVGGAATAELRTQPTDVAGGARLTRRLQAFSHSGMVTVFAVPDSEARHSLELSLTDEHVTIVESLSNAPENAMPPTPEWADRARRNPDPLKAGPIVMTDAPIPAGVVLPDARLAVVSAGDLVSRMAKHGRRRSRVDVTDITFPFKPGDYVVHATHGIAHFTAIVRQEVAGKERDYFLLEYAGGDKLYVPFEQVDRLTRYVGPDGDEPRLTRLNTADWSRATNKARKAAKKLAFDLVDLYTRRAGAQGFRFSPDSAWQREMEDAFPYQLTRDQESAIQDIKADMESPKPMDRLLCGDVGFGKTEVALRAAFKATQDGKQVMVLCPTTILAQQHFQTFSERFEPFNVHVEVLSRFRTTKQQKAALAGFADGSVQVLVGTHRLLSNDVNPRDLGLVIIDEEQRFGVQHKEQLKNLREQVDVLTLSATPIPRTMQMAVSGVRDMSLIKTPPAHRRPVKVHVGEWDEDVVSAAIRLELGRGGQCYYVSNRVRDIDDAARRVMSVAPEARVGVAHGKMSPKEIEDVMEHFAAGDTDVLIATTIIESGIDNPHTNTLIIEDAQRLGLAQLYQLKGRVGRGRTQAYAYFMFPPDKPLTPEATDRLMAINEFTDLGSGMKVAMRDLEIRGAGSLMGAEQHGNLSSVGFDLYTQMLGQAVAAARGEEPDEDPTAPAASSVNINLPVDYYLDEEYVPDVDRRVLAYRKLAAASDLEAIDALQEQMTTTFGEPPAAARNLFDRARIRVRADRLGITLVGYQAGKIQLQGAQVPLALVKAWRAKGAIVFAKSGKVTYPYRKGEEELLPSALALLEELGGADDADE